MARFIDLDEEHGDSPVVEDHLRRNLNQQPGSGEVPPLSAKGTDAPPSSQTSSTTTTAHNGPERIRNAVTRAFQCYPIVSAIVSSIDLNTLDALARVSFFIHDGLIQNRQVLIQSTLHCSFENVPVDPEETLRFRARAGNWFNMEDGRNFNGKSGQCARDRVGQCRRCDKVVCRNCAIKPPASNALRERHRRLCNTCTRAPIAALANPILDTSLPPDSDAVHDAICKCDALEGVWLCQPCGRSIRGADHEYLRIWRWRSQYGEVLGGLGTGIGDGDRGVICGRDADCFAAKEREQETDCDAEDARDADYASSHSSTPSPPAVAASSSSNPIETVLHIDGAERTPSPQLGPGYERHEIEGIGGVVKRKLVRMVRVGACVPEWEDERGVGRRPLGREIRGETRSWCGWCWRVIPSKDEMARA